MPAASRSTWREVIRAVAHGMPVMHGDADTDLAHYPDGAFDYVVLSRTLQAVEQPRAVLRQMLRIGTRAVVSFPNFGHWLVRWQLLSTGRMPVTPTWDRPWHETPNIHPCTIRDFFDLCDAEGYAVESWLAADDAGGRDAVATRALAGEPVRGTGAVPVAAGVGVRQCAPCATASSSRRPAV